MNLGMPLAIVLVNTLAFAQPAAKNITPSEPPDSAAWDVLTKGLQDSDPEQLALASFCQALLCSNRFLYID